MAEERPAKILKTGKLRVGFICGKEDGDLVEAPGLPKAHHRRGEKSRQGAPLCHSDVAIWWYAKSRYGDSVEADLITGPGEVTVLQAGGDGICKMARLLADAPHPYIYITPAENWGAVSSQSFNRTANWNYWTDPRQCLEERDRGVMTASSPDYLYAIKDIDPRRSRFVRDWLETTELRRRLGKFTEAAGEDDEAAAGWMLGAPASVLLSAVSCYDASCSTLGSSLILSERSPVK